MSRVFKRYRKPSSFERYLKPNQVSREINAMLEAKSVHYFPNRADEYQANEVLILMNSINAAHDVYRSVISNGKAKTLEGYEIQIKMLEHVIEYTKYALYIFQNFFIQRGYENKHLSSRTKKIRNRFIKVIRMLIYTREKSEERLKKIRRSRKELIAKIKKEKKKYEV